MKFCEQPDRHVPKIVCGYPMPCPHHSVLVVVGTVPEKAKRCTKRFDRSLRCVLKTDHRGMHQATTRSGNTVRWAPKKGARK